jgi:sugar/nucleoside kinase (ribokinase family)
VVVNDFGHGFLTDKIVRLICAKAKFLCLNVQANSANYGFNVITKYPRADFICIDEQELRLATHDRYGDIFTMTKKVLRLLNCRDIIVTRGPYGSLSLSKKDGFIQVPALSQKVIDRIGAGDALFAITAPCVYAGVERDIISFVGNVAAALKVQVIGNKQQTDFKEMTKFITRLLK